MTKQTIILKNELEQLRNNNVLKEKEIQLQDTDDDDVTTESDSSSESDDEYVAVIG